jgi:hypothetical protein
MIISKLVVIVEVADNVWIIILITRKECISALAQLSNYDTYGENRLCL